MNRTLRVYVHIDHLQLTGADLVHRHELAPQICARLTEEIQALLAPGGNESNIFHALNLSRSVTIDAVRAAPLVFQWALRPALLAGPIAKQVASALRPATGLQAGNEMTAADRRKA